MFFQQGEKEIADLKQKDKRLGEVIDKVGKIEREVDADLFSSVVHNIVGQQISTKAQATIWQRLKENLGTVSADAVLSAGIERLQATGITFKKAEYITCLLYTSILLALSCSKLLHGFCVYFIANMIVFRRLKDDIIVAIF